MATPSSSTTTPSPLLGYRNANGVVSSSKIANSPKDLAEAEDRERAVKKFLASAEVSKLTRGLRTRLGYASYKATHNLSASTLRDLEAQTSSQSIPYHRPPPGGNSGGISLLRKGSMGPPPPVTASAGQSLFASILGPSPTKRARTVRNPQDPRVPAPVRPVSTTSSIKKGTGSERALTSQPGVHTSVAERTRSHAKAPQRDAKKKQRASRKTKGKNAALNEVDDIKAAATLTSLLMHSRPGAMSASSPRSSISERSDSGSAYSHFVQSSTRTTTGYARPSDSHDPSKTPSASPPINHMGVEDNSRTPKTKRGAGGTPRPAPTDNEAAELMMFLATSPSPARPSVNRNRDVEAYRTLGGGVSALTGRVLFSGSSDGNKRLLSRAATGSFASTSTAVSETLGNRSSTQTQETLLASPRPSLTSTLVDLSTRDRVCKQDDNMDIHMETVVTPPTPITPHLLPPQSPRTSSDPLLDTRPDSLHSSFDGSRSFDFFTPDSRQNNAPHTPGSVAFNMNEFINVSPSPVTPRGVSINPASRVDIGRKLFADEHTMKGIIGPDGGGRPANSSGGNYLAPGIDFSRGVAP